MRSTAQHSSSWQVAAARQPQSSHAASSALCRSSRSSRCCRRVAASCCSASLSLQNKGVRGRRIEQARGQAGIQASTTVWPGQTGRGRRIAASTDGARPKRSSHTNQPTPGATTRKSTNSRKQKQAHLSRMLSAPPIRRRATAADVLGRGLGGSSSAARGVRRSVGATAEAYRRLATVAAWAAAALQAGGCRRVSK